MQFHAKSNTDNKRQPETHTFLRNKPEIEIILHFIFCLWNNLLSLSGLG